MSGYNQERGEQEYFQAMNSLHCREGLRLLASHALGARLSICGDQYCYLLGDNPMNGVCGYGETPHKAALDFDKNYYNGKIKVEEKKEGEK